LCMKSVRMRAFAALLLTLTMSVAAAGCAADADHRSPEEWLSMAYSGLAAMDQYHFTGAISMGMNEELMFKPQMFEGKVTRHKQLTIQSDEQDPVSWNPVDVLGKLNDANAGVTIIHEGVTETESGAIKTLTIRVEEKSDVTTARWDSLLRQQFDDIAGVSGADTLITLNVSEKRDTILAQSKKELEEMLSRLHATSRYDIVIDKQRLLPIKMEELTSFEYECGGTPIKESRHTSVRFEKFEGSAEDSVQ
jgi:DNA-binding LytR/AlgR family response regulator